MVPMYGNNTSRKLILQSKLLVCSSKNRFSISNPIKILFLKSCGKIFIDVITMGVAVLPENF